MSGPVETRSGRAGGFTEAVRGRLAGAAAEPTGAQVAGALRAEERMLGDTELLSLAAELTAAFAGAGPLEPLLRDEAITDVLVNGPGEVWVDAGAGLVRTTVRFPDEKALRRFAQRLATAAGRRLDDAVPYADARLPGGARLHAVLPPVAASGTCLSLRIPRPRAFSLGELVEVGGIPEAGASLLGALVAARAAFLLTGGTGTGKTTLLSSLLSLVPSAERIVLVEDSAELRPAHDHVVRLEARPPNVEGAGGVGLRDLVRQALRMRPDRLVVGEVRGAEIVDLLAALNTGHEGGCAKLTELNHEFSQFRDILAVSLLASRLMIDGSDPRDLARLVVLDVGRLAETGDPWEPYRLLDADGSVVEPVASFLAELQAADRSVATLKSYGNDLLLWWRWLAAVGVPWNRATPIEGRDFARWMQIADKPVRAHWRYQDGAPPPASVGKPGRAKRPPGSVNPVTGKAGPGRKYAPATRAHAETALRSFYDFHLETGQGPIVNPFPLDRSRRAARANAHHNPMDLFKHERKGRYRPHVPKRIPKRIPDVQFNEIFAGLKYHRDRALLAFWVSTGARAEELLDSFQGDVDPGEQLLSVTRKGSRAVQRIPASPDAFVWLRLYQEEAWKRRAPRGRDQPLWFTLRRPFRQLTYPAARAMFNRANELLGSNWSIHDLRHTAAWRMAKDPQMSLTDVQWILAHASLTTTQLYTTPDQHEVIATVLAHHQRRAKPAVTPPPPAPGYNPESLRTLFGTPS